MISPNDVRIGSVFRRDGKVLKVLTKQHVKLSKGGACQQVKCLDMETGSSSEFRLNVNEDLEEVYVNKSILTYSYSDGDTAYFLNSDCEIVELHINDLDQIADIFRSEYNPEFEVMPKIEIEYFSTIQGSNKTVNVRLVEDIALKVLETRPSIKGEAAKAGLKPATVQGGIEVKVPTHVSTGDTVILSKTDLSYVSKK